MNIFPEDQVDENLFELYYHPYKKQIWAFGTVFMLVVIAILGAREHKKSTLDEQWTRYRDALDVAADPGTRSPEERARAVAASLDQVAADYPDASVTPYVLADLVGANRQAGNYEAALTHLDRLGSEFPDFPLNALSVSGEQGTTTLADELRDTIERQRAWDAATAYEHRWPTEDRLALIETTHGSLWIGFYGDDSPEHVAAFIRHAKAGDYNGTQVFELRKGVDGETDLVRMGSRASKEERNPFKHDRDEPTSTIEPEDGRFTLRHEYRTIGADEMDSGESSQAFMIITERAGFDRYNGTNTVFAAVMDREDSLATLDRIARAQTYNTNPETAEIEGAFDVRDNPYPPVRIRRVTIWTEEKIDDDHGWDVSRAATADPEPWEAELPAPPTPDEFTKPSGPAPGLPEEGREQDQDEADDSEESTDEPDDGADDGTENDTEPPEDGGDKPEKAPEETPEETPSDPSSDD